MQRPNSINNLNKNTSVKKNDIYLLIGAPNVGKSSFFNRATKKYNSVANEAGFTTLACEGRVKKYNEFAILDLPGIKNLTISTNEEEVLLEKIIYSKYVGAINILGANTLKRDLLLSIQLAEAGILKHIVINMVDELKNKTINTFQIAKFLKVKVTEAISKKNIGINEVFISLMTKQESNPLVINYGNKLEELINEISLLISPHQVCSRFLALQFLTGCNFIHDFFDCEGILEQCNELLKKHNLTIEQTKEIIYSVRKDFCNQIISKAVIYNDQNINKLTKSKKFDSYILRPYIAIPFFCLLIFGIYYLCFGPYIGGFLADKLDEGLNLLLGYIGESMQHSGANEWAISLVTNGLFGGVATVLGFLPYIILLNICVLLVEQTGLMSRMGLILDKSFAKFGLSGRSILIMITGLGCSIPGISMAKNSSSFKERLVLIFIIPLISCSARVVVFNWIISALVTPNLSWLLVLFLTIFSAIMALILGLMLSNTLFRNHRTFLLTEMPKYRVPDFISILKSTSIETWNFLKRLITIIFVANFIVFILMFVGPIAGAIDPSNLNNGDSLNPTNTSFLQYIGYGIKYLFYPIGFGDNWKIVTTLISSVPAKELAASNIELIYGSQEAFKDAYFGLNPVVKYPISTIISFFAFFSFFSPCLSTDIVIKKELNAKYMWLQLLISMVFSYLLCFLLFSYASFIELSVSSFPFSNIAFNLILYISFSLLAIYLIIALVYKVLINIKQCNQSILKINLFLQKFKPYYGWSFIGLLLIIGIIFECIVFLI